MYISLPQWHHCLEDAGWLVFWIVIYYSQLPKKIIPVCFLIYNFLLLMHFDCWMIF
jgi:hypothetical protein